MYTNSISGDSHTISVGFNNRIKKMKRIRLPKDVWVSLYGRLHDTLSHATRIKEVKSDDVRDEVLNIMNFYFDRVPSN
jgi:hypothetical protein